MCPFCPVLKNIRKPKESFSHTFTLNMIIAGVFYTTPA